jgi:hypothetical protein
MSNKFETKKTDNNKQGNNDFIFTNNPPQHYRTHVKSISCSGISLAFNNNNNNTRNIININNNNNNIYNNKSSINDMKK